MIRTLVPVKVAPPPPVRVQATLEEIQEHVSVFEATHPGFGRHNYADAFRDERGDLVESGAFEAIDCWYALLETQE